MLRVAKPEGFGNVILEEVPLPTVGPRDVLVRNKVSLISRGSEILRRYMHAEAIDPAIMGYSVGGVVEAVGDEAAARFQPGDRVAVVAPHAQFVLQDIDAMEGTRIWPLPDDISLEQGAFLPLALGGVMWAAAPGIRSEDTVVILGQGLVGNLVMQAVRLHGPEQLITVDTIAARCRLSQQLGADIAINGGEQDPVATVRTLTNGKGAAVVIDCVGGEPGLTSFVQAQEMVRDGGTLHLIGLYHGAPLPLDASKIQRRRLIGGYYGTQSRVAMLPQTIKQLQHGQLQAAPLISHRFPYTQAKVAYDLLYERLPEAMGVLLIWE
ncbi:MAG TPA: zinc-binding dehydrogenase [Caldilineaceae bacterium]|nr:zinc-binding dehydrogenase [Caldilineaceae bacterium]